MDVFGEVFVDVQLDGLEYFVGIFDIHRALAQDADFLPRDYLRARRFFDWRAGGDHRPCRTQLGDERFWARRAQNITPTGFALGMEYSSPRQQPHWHRIEGARDLGRCCFRNQV